MTMNASQSKEEYADVLETFPAPDSAADQVYTFETSELTAECPFDFGGPDFYEFVFRYTPQQECIESKSLKLYLESFRGVKITAEEMGAHMYTDFEALMNPERMYLRLEQARRGGIEETVEFGDRSLRRHES